MKIYLSGPMSGRPLYNYPAFHEAAAYLRELWGPNAVFNPAESLLDPATTERFRFMRDDIRALGVCDQLVLLPGWQQSRGATLEAAVALEMGLVMTTIDMGAPRHFRVWPLTENEKAFLEAYLAVRADTVVQRTSHTPGPPLRSNLNAQQRKALPLTSGVLDYFPDALLEVAHCSKVGNDQHNPGQPLHWAKEKSTDEADALARHLLDRGTMDTDGVRHSAKVAWRALALLQREIDAEGAK